MSDPIAPASRNAPAPIVDLSAGPTRERLCPAAAKAFFNIVERWRIGDDQARALLGGPSMSTYHAWRKLSGRTLDTDTLTRLSYLVGIFEALDVLYGERLADEWVSLPNGNPIFAGGTPLSYMIAGGIPALQTVRRLLEARRGGA